MRWFRLAFPTYLVLLFAFTIFQYMGRGPIFNSSETLYVQEPLSQYWWTILAFCSNVMPWNEQNGLYWLFFVSNDLQFFIVVLIPTLIIYSKY